MTLLHDIIHREDITHLWMDRVTHWQRCHRTSKVFFSDEKGPIVKDKYPMFEWVPGTHILDKSQDDAPDIINEDELDV